LTDSIRWRTIQPPKKDTQVAFKTKPACKPAGIIEDKTKDSEGGTDNGPAVPAKSNGDKVLLKAVAALEAGDDVRRYTSSRLTR